MRYYNFVMAGNSKLIEEKSEIKLREYAWESPVGAVNAFMKSRVKNDMGFFIFREEENTLMSAFYYDDKKTTLQDCYDNTMALLRETFGLKKIVSAPWEVTTQEFLDCWSEARRRDYHSRLNMVDEANLWMHESKLGQSTAFTFEEKMIVPQKGKQPPFPCDRSFLRELDEIESQNNETVQPGNMVHYVIAARSKEAAARMTETLAERLWQAGRLSHLRMSLVSDMSPELYRASSKPLEVMIENNTGGVIVLDLSAKFGAEPSEYGILSSYLENLLKKYRNDCLFVFTYNMDAPGFSYYFLQNMEKYVLPVHLREGSGDRKTAVAYLKSLIKQSSYQAYAAQAGEYMKQFPGNDFTQTDVLEAFERFGPWSSIRNGGRSYSLPGTEEFILDRDERGASAYDKLQSMIGLQIVKRKIDGIIARHVVEKERKRRMGKAYESSAMHMVFSGNPGTAKTTVARLLAGVLKEKGILKSGVFVERGGMNLNHPALVREAFQAAKGGVLFVDEAYGLWFPSAVTAFIQELENRRDEVLVVLAGYRERMQDFLKLNEGFKSRIPYQVEFPDYTVDELMDIFRLMSREKGFSLTEKAELKARQIFEKAICLPDFGNGRYARNLLDQAVEKQAGRLMGAGKEAGSLRKRELFELGDADIAMVGDDLKEVRTAGTARKELEDMIGLSSAKAIIRKAIAAGKMNKARLEKGLAKRVPSMHMVFTGNPGTAKTTVARLFAEIMRDEKILASGNFVEVGRADLVAGFVGPTAPLVKRRFQEARGGVLFIDEAYSLCDSVSGSFGDEAINTIVQEMENHREDVVVIFAGYPAPMEAFLNKNPGMRSRIAFQVPFDDYSVEELCAITELMARNKQQHLTPEAMAKCRALYERVCGEGDFGNGRFVRKIMEEAEMNLSMRLVEQEDEMSSEKLSTLEACDIPELPPRKQEKKRQIGFAS